MARMKNRKGFSLLELIVVIAIIGIIAGAVMINAGQFTYPAKYRTWRTTMDSLKDALILYSTTRGGGAFPAPPTNPVDIDTWLSHAGGVFLDKYISNPFNGSGTVIVCGPSGTLVPVDKATTYSDCVVKYTTKTFIDPINGFTIDNGSFFIYYKIGTKTYIMQPPP